MRFYGLAIAATAVMLGACGGGDKNANDTAAAATDSATAAPSADAGAPAAGGAAAAITGTTHTVNMVGDEKGYRFEPANITVKQGDGIKFVMVSGGPHNVAFQNVSGEAATKLSANMPEQMAPLSGKLLVNPNEEYTVSFAGVPAGKYDFNCTPHAAMNMVGSVTVQ